MDFISNGNPTKTAVYLVDRGMQGKWHRYFNAETEKWGGCANGLTEAFEMKDSKVELPFYPWLGPITGPKFESIQELIHAPISEVTTKQPKQATKQPKVKSVSDAKAEKKSHPDGTVFYRADREKWVAVWNGKQEAAKIGRAHV